MNIASIVTTCKRPGVSYLNATLRSLRTAGFDPDVMLDHELKGSFRNFKDALQFIVRPDADAVIVFQDDIEVAAGLRAWLDSNLWPHNPEKIGVLSLYTSSLRDHPMTGWQELQLNVNDENSGRPRLSLGALGALAYVFPIRSARQFLKDDPRVEMLSSTDIFVGEWCANSGLQYWTMQPSLVQHIGEVTTFTKRYPTVVPLAPCITEARQAKRFCNDVSQLVVGETLRIADPTSVAPNSVSTVAVKR